jgi:hypothetical protein
VSSVRAVRAYSSGLGRYTSSFVVAVIGGFCFVLLRQGLVM